MVVSTLVVSAGPYGGDRWLILLYGVLLSRRSKEKIRSRGMSALAEDI